MNQRKHKNQTAEHYKKPRRSPYYTAARGRARVAIEEIHEKKRLEQSFDSLNVSTDFV